MKHDPIGAVLLIVTLTLGGIRVFLENRALTRRLRRR